MKLIKFDASTTKFVRPGLARIRFERKGITILNKPFMEAARLEKGDKVSIVQDAETPEDWYVIKDEKGFTLRVYPSNDCLCFNSAYIARSFMSFLSVEACSVSCMLSTEAVESEDEDMQGFELYPIITKSATYNE